jgi:Flp pilus assembly pilin Flp
MNLINLITTNLRTKLSVRREEGQALTEYALILTFVTVVAIAALTLLGEDVTKLLKEIGEKL